MNIPIHFKIVIFQLYVHDAIWNVDKKINIRINLNSFGSMFDFWSTPSI